MAKGKRRKASQVAKAAKKGAAYLRGGGESDYAKKHAEQARGKFRPTSPFYLTPGERKAVLEGAARGLGTVRE